MGTLWNQGILGHAGGCGSVNVGGLQCELWSGIWGAGHGFSKG